VAPATLEDKSHSGLSVRLKQPIPIGTHVTVKRGSEQISGAVAYSRLDRGNYVIGVKRDADENSRRKS
jgi:hypothetical protein